MLNVFCVWQVRTPQFQLTHTSKKRKLGDGIFTEEGEEDEAVSVDWESYLDRLQSLLVAYTLASPPAG